MVFLSIIKPRVVMLFNVSEHVCAVGYACSEFAFLHTRVILDIASAILLIALGTIGCCKAFECHQKLWKGYRSPDIDKLAL